MVKDFTEDWAQIWRQMYDLSAIRVFLFSSVMQNKLDASYKSGETNAIIVAWCFSSSVINAAHAPLRQQWWLFKIISMTGCKNRLDLKETSFMYCILFKETNVFFLKKKIMFNKNTLSEIWLWSIFYNPWHGVKKKDTCLHLPVGSFGSETWWKWALTHDEWDEREPPLTCKVLLSVSGTPTPTPQPIPHGIWQW